ncbi:MAG: EFR1 family ferrodoxin [Bacteroidales bacterium]|nr:EFR1 family ferrodoxin [Bacteroidales bacterium]
MDLYFLTGTGNSYWSAITLRDLAESEGVTTNVIPVDVLKKKDIILNRSDDLYGFLYPTHGFSLPWHMLKFMLKFPAGKGRIFFVNNRAGMKLSKLYTPGISGIAVLVPMLIFLIKGYKIAGTMPLDTPSNWISIHPGLRPRIVNSIFDRRVRDVGNLWNRLAHHKRVYPAKFWILLPVDIFVSPVSFGYMLYGRFLLGRTYIADYKCDGCGLCAAYCPVSAIKMVNNRPYWTYRCESCMRCSNICPKSSINSSVPLAITYTWLLIWIIGYKGPFAEIWRWIDQAGPLASFIIEYAVWWVITLILAWVVYQVVFILSKIRIFNIIFTYTTPMKFWRHYLAPGFRGKYK